MSIATEITRLQNAKAAIKTAIEGKGVTVPDATLMDGMAALIDAIEAGGGGDISPWVDMVTFSITPTTDLSGQIDFTSYFKGRTTEPHVTVIAQRETVDSGYIQSMARIRVWNSWQRLFYGSSSSTSTYPFCKFSDNKFLISTGSYSLQAGKTYWGCFLWR